MNQESKDALKIWAGTILGGAGGWLGATKLISRYGLPASTWGVIAGGLLGAFAGAALTKMIVQDPGAVPLPDSSDI